MSTIVLNIPPKEEDIAGGEFHEDRANKISNHLHKHLELRLGMPLINGSETGDAKGVRAGGDLSSELVTTTPDTYLLSKNNSGLGGAKRSFCEASKGFVHPWSLAARQEKAALEQAHQKPASIVSRTNSPTTVGWPPVHSFRKNLAVMQPPKITVGPEKNAETTMIVEEENIPKKFQEMSTMFVKVNMEGYAVGRKINLKAHDGYDSLSHSLQNMFYNFLSANYLNNQTQNERDEVKSPNYILLYEDTEGDRMLVGDVPWEMFISSVKRLYITQDPRPTWLTTTEKTKLKSKSNGAEMV